MSIALAANFKEILHGRIHFERLRFQGRDAMNHTAEWGFLTNHALVLIFVVRHPGATVREISAGVGVTERATLEILRQLESRASWSGAGTGAETPTQ